MGFKIHPLVGQTTILHEQVQKTEQKVDTSTITLTMRDALFRELSREQHVIGRLAKQVQTQSAATDEFAKAQIQDTLEGLEGLNERIVRLYGKIQNRVIATEVADITKEAAALETVLETGDEAQIAEAVSHLDEHIEAFTHDFAPGREERRQIADARAKLQTGYARLQTPGLRQDTPYLMNQPNLLQLIATQREPLEDDEVPFEIVMEIFESAECFFHGNTRDGMKNFHQLSEEAKRRFRVHLAILGEPSGNPMADPITTTQALIATAHDLADSSDGDTYLSPTKLKKLFAHE